MPAPKVKADYHLLDLIAAQFSREAELAQQMFDLLSKQMSSLESGDWVGQGANAFYSEMHNQVLPALVRLRDAMRHSAGVTRQIRQIMQAAEIEAAAIFWVFGVLFGGKAAPRITYRASSIAQPLDEATKAFWESRWGP